MEGKYPSWGQAAKQVPQLGPGRQTSTSAGARPPNKYLSWGQAAKQVPQLGPGRQTSTSAGARPPNKYLSWGQAAKQAADRHELRSLVSDLVINRQEED